MFIQGDGVTKIGREAHDGGLCGQAVRSFFATDSERKTRDFHFAHSRGVENLQVPEKLQANLGLLYIHKVLKIRYLDMVSCIN
jgi:hypothetical protein